MVLADVVKDYSQTVMLSPEEAEAQTLPRLFAPLYERARADLLAEGIDGTRLPCSPRLDMRYVGQSYELGVAVSSGTGGNVQRYVAGLSRGTQTAVLVRQPRTSRSRSSICGSRRSGSTSKPQFSAATAGGRRSQGPRTLATSRSTLRTRATPVLPALFRLPCTRGSSWRPATLSSGRPSSFSLTRRPSCPPDWAATVDGWGNLVVQGR